MKCNNNNNDIFLEILYALRSKTIYRRSNLILKHNKMSCLPVGSDCLVARLTKLCLLNLSTKFTPLQYQPQSKNTKIIAV